MIPFKYHPWLLKILIKIDCLAGILIEKAELSSNPNDQSSRYDSNHFTDLNLAPNRAQLQFEYTLEFVLTCHNEVVLLFLLKHCAEFQLLYSNF